MTNKPTALTPLERTVLDELWKSALDTTGGDFAMLNEVSIKNIGRKALGGVVTSLGEKRVIGVHVTYVNGSYKSKGERVVQITFPDATIADIKTRMEWA